MPAIRFLSFVVLLSAVAGAAAQDKPGDAKRVFVVVEQQSKVKGKATFTTMGKVMKEVITKERPTIARPAFGGFTPVMGESAKTMFEDAVKEKAGLLLHVQMQEVVRGPAPTKMTTVTAQYTVYEPKAGAAPDKPQQYWQKAASQTVKASAPEVDPEAFGAKAAAGKVPHDAYEFLVLDLQYALVKRFVTVKSIEGKAEKGTLTVTVTVANTGKHHVTGLVLAVPHEDSVIYQPTREADVPPGETKKVTYTIKDPAAAKLVWKNAKLSEIYLKKE